jgi:hypothetical protein
MVRMRENIVPILESYGVDLVLTGHSHVYERTWLLSGHYGFSSTFAETHKVDAGDGKLDGSGAYQRPPGSVGTVYITAAVGGQPRDSMPGVKHPAHLLKKSGILGSLVLDVDGGRLDCKYLNTSGGVEDYFTIIKEIAAPKLVIYTSQGMTTVSWPASAEGYVLEYCSDLKAGMPWQTVQEGMAVRQGDIKSIRFENAGEGPAGFFRLVKP